MLVALTCAWAVFVAWCVSGFPPALDLPAHAAQIQTLADLLWGDTQAAQHYRPTFPIGYGLTTWLFAPLAWLTDGALAARFALWLSVVLLPLAHARLARALGRTPWVAVLSAPLGFGVSYWYGFLPTVFALPWTLLAWASFVSLNRTAGTSWGRLLLFAFLALVTMQSHLVIFGVLATGVAALALGSLLFMIA